MATFGIHGLDVTEGYPVDPTPEATAARQAQAARAGIRATPVADALAAEARAPSAATTYGRAVGRTAGAIGNGIRSVGGAVPAIAGVALNRAVDKFGAPANTADGVPTDAQRGATSQIPSRPGEYQAPAAQAPSFFRDSEVGRNVGNIINAIPGLGQLSGTLRAGSGVAKAADIAGATLRSAGVDNALPRPAAVPQSVPALGATPQAPYSDARQGPAVPAAAPASVPALGAVQNITPANGGGNVSGGSPLLEMQAHEARMAAAGRVDPGAHNEDGTGGIADLGGRGPLVVARNQAQYDTDRRQYLLEQGLKSTNKGIRDASMHGIATGDTSRSQNLATQSAERVAGIRERGETARAVAANANNRFIRNQDNQVTLRGQDTTLAGHRMTNDVARAKMAREQFNSDRSYEMDKAKYGTEVAEKNRTAGEAAAKATQAHLENQFRSTDDKGNSVPDHAKIASYNTALQSTLPAFIGALQQAGTPEALAKAKELQTRGHAALGPEDHAQLTQLFQTREQLRGTRSKLPGGAEFSDSDNLMNFRQKPGAAGIQRNTLTPNRVQFVGGSSATPNDLSIEGGANAFVPDWGKVRNDNLTRGIRGID